MAYMITHVKILEEAQPDNLETSIKSFLNDEDALPSLRTAQENRSLQVTVSHSETWEGLRRPEARYMAVIMWQDIL